MKHGAVNHHPCCRGPLTPPARTPGFTLIEVVVSLTIMSIVFLSIGSVLMLAGKAVPNPNDPLNLTFTAADVLQDITSELHTATSITAYTDKSITFTVPDRDGDASDETITYLWDGVAGNGLSRQYNGGTAVTLVSGVQQFGLDYDIIPIPQPNLIVEGSEQLLDNHPISGSPSSFTVTAYNWIGQLIDPDSVPSNAVDWNVTRVYFQAKTHNSATGKMLIQLRPAIGWGYPSSTILASQVLNESSLSSSYQWVLFDFSSVRGIDPTDELCLVTVWQAGNEAGGIRYNSWGGTDVLYSYTQGSVWLTGANNSMYYYVYGTYTTSEPQPDRDGMRSVTMILNLSEKPLSRTRTAVSMLNHPLLP
jgi:prepilin-type N-terminal cleavage/methylation domain-containing protein